MIATTPTPVSVLLGGGRIGLADPTCRISEPAQFQGMLNIFRAHGHTTIDTSRLYPSSGVPGGSETLIGKTDHSSWGLVDTKVLSHAGQHTPENIATSISASLSALGISQLNTIYLHYPDRTIPLSTIIPAIASAVTKGQARRWAISNYSIAEVQSIIDVCKTNSLPLPAIYQGHYNAIVRSAEPELLPLLRKHNIAFYAYSPTAGGTFNPSSTVMAQQDHIGALIRTFYGSEKSLAAIQAVNQMAAKHGIASGHELAIRWTVFHSALDGEKGDGVVVGASSEVQLEATLSGLERGKLPGEVAEAVEALWIEGGVRETAPGYSPFLGDLDFRPGNDQN